MTMFPVDDVTLAMVEAALDCDNEDGRSHLTELLEFGAVETARESLGEVEVGGGYCDVYAVQYAPGRAPWHEHEVIKALIVEVRLLRLALGAALDAAHERLR